MIRGGERETSSREQAGSAGPMVCGSRSALWDFDFVPSPPVYPAHVAITACRSGERRGGGCALHVSSDLCLVHPVVLARRPAVTLSVVGGRSRAPFVFELRSSPCRAAATLAFAFARFALRPVHIY